MFLLFLVILLVVPVLELVVMAEVASSVGVAPTLALVISVSLFGLWLVRRQGAGVLRRARGAFDRGDLPTSEVLDGLLILTAGILLLIPGLLTDAVGLVLLVPPVRSLAKLFIAPRLQLLLRIPFGVAGAAARTRAARTADGRVRVGRAVIVSSGTELAGRQQGSTERDRDRGPGFGGSISGSAV